MLKEVKLSLQMEHDKMEVYNEVKQQIQFSHPFIARMIDVTLSQKGMLHIVT